MWNDEIEVVIDGALDVPAPMNMGVTRVQNDASPLALMVDAASKIRRDPKALIAAAKTIGGLLGTSGFYEFPAGGSTVSGVSIDLAQALAQQWGGIAYQVRIVSEEKLATGGKRVHLRATVTDLKALVAAEVDQVVTTSAPPGKFANKPDQAERWHAMQVQSAASKVVRNAILRVLPAWYVDPAFNAARETHNAQVTGGKTLPVARAGAVENFAKFGLKTDELEAFTGHAFDMWAAPQLSQLRSLYRDLETSTVSVEQVRANLRADATTAAVPATSGKTALGLKSGKTAPALPNGDDDPPTKPTGTDGGAGRGGNADAQGDGAQSGGAGEGAQAMATVHEIRVEREPDDSAGRENFTRDEEAWVTHLETLDAAGVCAAFHRRSAQFNRHSVIADRRRAAVTAIARTNGGNFPAAEKMLAEWATRGGRRAANG